eukprot:NODE_478_length_6971_cov_0.483411.p4 type:complete len:330 gc:universal NODE_478_length_6971_cov_0.483411:5109-4120(-)
MNHLNKFWNDFISLPKFKADDIIKLPFGYSQIIDDESVYIRRSYIQLIDQIKDTLKSTNHIILHGSPGIGKTLFSLLLLKEFNDSNIIYESSCKSSQFYFARSKDDQQTIFAHKEAPGTFDAELRKDSATDLIYISDAVKPVNSLAKTIYISNPQSEKWCDFDKTKCFHYYLPYWDLEELKICKSLFKVKACINELYNKWGGNPTFVLKYADCDLHQTWLNQSIYKLKIYELIHNYDGNQFDSEFIFNIVHYSTNNDFTDVQYLFASKHVIDLLKPRLSLRFKNYAKKSLGHVKEAEVLWKQITESDKGIWRKLRFFGSEYKNRSKKLK